LAIGLLAALALVACGGGGASPAASGTKPLKVALVLPGPANDKGFNQTAYEALQQIKTKFGANIAYSEDVPVPQYVQTYRNYAQQGFDVVIGQGFEFGDPAKQVAPDFPKTKFLVTASDQVSGSNLQGLNPIAQDPAYLVGVVAGMASKTGQVAGIAGIDFPPVVAQMEAYKLGAKSVRPDIKATTTYLGSFDDVQKAKEATRAAASGGVDVIFHVADAAGLGVIQAAQESKIYAIGFGGDQNSVAPNTVITSSVIDYTLMIVEAVQAIKDGKFTGKVRNFDINDPAVKIAPIRGLESALTSRIQAKVDEDRKAMIAGTLKVPFVAKPTT
jgi:basic membrane protein A